MYTSLEDGWVAEWEWEIWSRRAMTLRVVSPPVAAAAARLAAGAAWKLSSELTLGGPASLPSRTVSEGRPAQKRISTLHQD
jgi:hypothetical protein